METFAYIHVAEIYEASPDSSLELTREFQHLTRSSQLTPPHSLQWRLASITLALSILSLASSSLALKQGDTGFEVNALQTRLQDAGFFEGPLSGIYGPITEDAVKRFQEANNLSVDGIAGTETLTALENRARGGPAVAASTVTTSAVATPVADVKLAPIDATILRQGDSGPGVIALQTRLHDRGYFANPITGIYGAITEESVRQFQLANQITADGIAGPITLSKLEQSLATASGQGASGQGGPAINTSTSSAAPNNGTNQTRTTLQAGNNGADVTALQMKLMKLKFFEGPITGTYGPLTESAVKRFQDENNLVVDGLAGPTTLMMVENASKAATSGQTAQETKAQPEATKFSVLELQTRLKAHGFYQGPLDGELGPKTNAAIKSAQVQYGVNTTTIAMKP